MFDKKCLVFSTLTMTLWKLLCFLTLFEEFLSWWLMVAFFITFTFTFMHLADAFIQSDLQLHSGYKFLLVHVFPGNRTHNLSLSWRNVLPLSHTGTQSLNGKIAIGNGLLITRSDHWFLSYGISFLLRFCCALWLISSISHLQICTMLKTIQ